MRAITMLAFGFLAACGGADNVGACEDWIASLDCGDYDPGSVITCSVYEDYPCDISDYFNCLTEKGTCTDGVYDASGWAECTDLAQCD